MSRILDLPRRLVERLLTVLYGWAESGWSGVAAATWAVLQSAIIPGPSDAVLISLGLADPKRAPALAAWTVAGSVVGALIAYAIGALAFQSLGVPILGWLGVDAAHLEHISALLARRGWLIVALGSLPLLSSKATAIVAGGFGFALPPFIVVTAAVRGGRFVIEGLIIRFAGERLREWLARRRFAELRQDIE